MGDKTVDYTETLEFVKIKDEPATIFSVQSYTKKPDSDVHMHTENGFIKVFKGETKREAEANFSHPFGMNEIEYGNLEDDKLELATTDDSCFYRSKSGEKSAMSTAVTGIWRTYSLDKDGSLVFEQYLAKDHGEKKYHIKSVLRKLVQ